MGAIEILVWIGFFIMGICIGAGCAVIFTHKKHAGNLVVDTTDEDGPFMFLELEIKPEELMKEKKVCLEVKNRGYFES